MTSLDNLSLGELFTTGQAYLTELEETSLASIDPEYQAKVRDALSRLERANDLVRQLSIFSSNELLDDINTQDLRFLLIPVYLGDLTLKVTDPNRNRQSILETAKNYFDTFLSLCEEHQLMRSEDLRAYKNRQEGDNATIRLNAASQRQQKIEQYKREKATENQLKELRAQLNETDNAANDRDDMERDLVQAAIQLYIIKALQHLRAIDQELVMVKEMETMAEDRRRMVSGSQQDEPQPRDRRIPPPTWGRDKPLMNKQGKPLQPFVITNKRQQLKDQVFRPGHSLPTMTIDEYLQQEEERGNIIKGGGKSPPEKEEIDDNDHEALDADTMKKREWDEFTEANPRGWGNRGNKG
ncbi:TAP42-like protein [Zychaea mexicana]|uniref:TAP42-like protein n=1 Tax=Zychaea mexicana TaxID=64656 RepID=UPI0022FE1B65|nr:TAP42-like protein [Zychaea mexicana]KAI9488437.1 TAP42-like protein [Zychaea mexicana]